MGGNERKVVAITVLWAVMKGGLCGHYCTVGGNERRVVAITVLCAGMKGKVWALLSCGR